MKKKRMTNSKQSQRYVKSMFLLFSGILIFQIIVILITDTYHGTPFERIYKYYTNKNVYIKTRGIPLFWCVSLFGYIYNMVKRQ